jgi:hypothetical protein
MNSADNTPAKPRTALTPITNVIRYPNLRGRMEIWSAVSTDGVWEYERDEVPGTPWAVRHVPTDRWYYEPSLPKARAATASGAALKHLDAITARP